uniref:Fatty acid desaturase n=1 Tax=Mimivirus LCMiAC01 TaxID=2506608 RepID=A0A481Z0S0_9VIRU|nr:MAG: fatty acid desaturase [Mimivirus LCMiAC01]
MEKIAKKDITWLHGCPYDLRDFIKKHPGGDQIKVAFGEKDVTALYYSYHPSHKINPDSENSYKLETILENYRLEEPLEDKNKYENMEYEYNSDLALEIKDAVDEYFKKNSISKFANRKWWFKTVIYMSLNILFDIWYLWSPNYVNAMLFGISVAFVALNVTHDANHGSVSRYYPWINQLLGRTSDWLGHSQYDWSKKHTISHHQYTNDEQLDYNSDRLKYILNFSNRNKNWFHRNFQGIYMWVVLPIPWILLSFKFKDIIVKDGLVACILRIFFIYRLYVNPIMHHGLFHGFLIGTTTALSGTIILSYLFNLSHHFVGVYRENLKEGDDWYKHQIISSSDYGGHISSLLTGGLNIQIIHHLFPRINSIHYVTLQPIVEKICIKHGVKYVKFDGICQNILSTMKYFGLPSFISNRLNVVNNHNYKQN